MYLVWLLAGFFLLNVGMELAKNFRDQWVPRYMSDRLFGRNLTRYEVFSTSVMATLAVAAGGIVAFFIGWMLGGETWAFAWATLVLLGAMGITLWYSALAIEAGRKYKHPKNPKKPFWPS